MQRWVARHHAPLPRLLGGRLDVADPADRSLDEHLRIAARIADDLDTVLGAWFGENEATSAEPPSG